MKKKKLSYEGFIKVVKKKYKKIAFLYRPDRQNDKSEVENILR